MNLRFPAPVGTTCGQSVSYAGESYPTVQIGTQCWMAKNLNVGTMISGTSDQTNNSTLEKYCYNNNPANCSIYGGLYQWAEAVQYQNGASNTSSPSPAFGGNIKGICPTGWHVPSDGEFCTLTTFLDATVNCGATGWSGTDAGGRMKSTSGLWFSPNTGASGNLFNALPAGARDIRSATFRALTFDFNFWTSTENSNNGAWTRDAAFNLTQILRDLNYKDDGYSIRCIKD
jgi:uncharacterized protein (TIGR02145 family)